MSTHRPKYEADYFQNKSSLSSRQRILSYACQLTDQNEAELSNQIKFKREEKLHTKVQGKQERFCFLYLVYKSNF